MMRAVTYGEYGGPEVLSEVLVDAPTPKQNEVLVRVHAASVNGYDIAARSGALRMFTSRKFPKRTGLDFAGEVVSASAATSPFRSGDRVWGVTPLHQLGSVAELVCVDATQLAHYPSELDPVAAAALPVVGSTVITALRDMGELKTGQRLLVRGASGGVGSVAVQLGRAFGAHVTGVASAANLDFVRGIGADEAHDYAATAPADLSAFDVILDTIGSNMRGWRQRLAPLGRMMAIVPDLQHPLASMAYIAWSGVHRSRRIRFFSDKPDTRLLTDLANYVRQGAIKPIVDSSYALTEISDAHRAMEAGGGRGKYVIRVT